MDADRSVSRIKCLVPSCRNSRNRNPKLSFHTFPKINTSLVANITESGLKEKIDRYKAWNIKLKLHKLPPKAASVCYLHFKRNDFLLPVINMPQGPKHNPLMKPFVVLALPGMYLFYKYNQYKRKRKENATRRLAERELQYLNNKIDKLLARIEATEQDLATCPEEECVICVNARANMLTVPCGHQVVCRKCFVKTIQNAVAQRLLPLRCVICRSKVLRLKTSHFPTSASGYSMDSATSSVPQSDSLYSVSSGGSSISSTSCSSEIGKGPPCCGGRCSGAYPRQPTTGAIKRSQQHAMKMKIQDYCRPDKNHVNRLPPIKELPGQSPLHTAPPASTRIRCAQKIITQLELPMLRQKGHKYEKLSQEDDDEIVKTDNSPDREKRWWTDKKWDRTKSEEKIDNKKNEIVEKQMELKEKLIAKADKIKGRNEQNIIEERL